MKSIGKREGEREKRKCKEVKNEKINSKGLK
jgi:hypothetical protein